MSTHCPVNSHKLVLIGAMCVWPSFDGRLHVQHQKGFTMNKHWLAELHAFIVKAKAATYVGDGLKSLPNRPGAHELQYDEGDFAYIDSYFGGADFLGQEIVRFQGEPVWAMNYYGRILHPTRITAAETGHIIKTSLSLLYAEGRFLGGFQCETPMGTYIDTNEGDETSFIGREWINQGGLVVYELVYHGGLVKP